MEDPPFPAVLLACGARLHNKLDILATFPNQSSGSLKMAVAVLVTAFRTCKKIGINDSQAFPSETEFRLRSSKPGKGNH